MKKLIKRYRSDGGFDHQEAVSGRLRALSSVSHDLIGHDPAALRRRLNGGRSALATGPAMRTAG